MRRLDRVLGIGLGLVLGVGAVIAFVFLGSEQTIDAPRVDSGSAQQTTTHRPATRRRGGGHAQTPSNPPVAEVDIAGGAPPPGGPPHLDYHQGDRVRLRIRSDSTVGLELLGYGITTTADAGTAKRIAFTATKPGNFPLIVAASHIGVAEIRVDPR